MHVFQLKANTLCMYFVTDGPGVAEERMVVMMMGGRGWGLTMESTILSIRSLD